MWVVLQKEPGGCSALGCSARGCSIYLELGVALSHVCHVLLHNVRQLLAGLVFVGKAQRLHIQQVGQSDSGQLGWQLR